MADIPRLERLAEYYEHRKAYEQAGDVLAAAGNWNRAMPLLSEAALLHRQASRYREAKRCYIKAARAAIRLDRYDRADQLQAQAAGCEEFLGHVDLSTQLGKIPPAITEGAEIQAQARVRSAEIGRDGRLEAHRMWNESFRSTMIQASERLFDGLRQLSAAHIQMGQDLSHGLVKGFETLSKAQRDAVLRHGEMILEGLRTLSKATLAGHLIEAITCLKHGEMLSEAERQAAMTISDGICRAGKDEREGMESVGRSLLDGMNRASQAIEVHGQLTSEATRHASDVEADVLRAVAEEVGAWMTCIDEGIRKHSRVLRTSIMGGLFSDADRGFLKSLVWDWPTQRAFRPGLVQATKQLGTKIDHLRLPDLKL